MYFALVCVTKLTSQPPNKYARRNLKIVSTTILNRGSGHSNGAEVFESDLIFQNKYYCRFFDGEKYKLQ